MAYGGNPASDKYDAIRAMVGDTDESNELLDIGMLQLAYARGTDLYSRSAIAADMLHAKFVGEATVRVGDVWFEGKVLAGNYLKMAEKLRLQGQKNGGGGAWLGGHTISDRDSRREDTDIVQPSFEVNMMNAVGTSQTGIFVNENENEVGL